MGVEDSELGISNCWGVQFYVHNPKQLIRSRSAVYQQLWLDKDPCQLIAIPSLNTNIY